MQIQDSLGYLLNTSARLIKRRVDNSLAELGLTTAQFAALSLLQTAGPLSQTEIATRLHSDKATVGVVIDKLAARSLVSRERSDSDRRSYIVSLAAGTDRLVTEGQRAAMQANQAALGNLPPADALELSRLLNLVIKNLDPQDAR